MRVKRRWGFLFKGTIIIFIQITVQLQNSTAKSQSGLQIYHDSDLSHDRYQKFKSIMRQVSICSQQTQLNFVHLNFIKLQACRVVTISSLRLCNPPLQKRNAYKKIILKKFTFQKYVQFLLLEIFFERLAKHVISSKKKYLFPFNHQQRNGKQTEKCAIKLSGVVQEE